MFTVIVLDSGLIVSGSEDSTMRIWNRESGAEEQVKKMEKKLLLKIYIYIYIYIFFF